MKVLPSHNVANEGQTRVQSDFHRMGWGAVPNPYDDFGIDLLVMARTEDGTDKGLCLGAQVKSGRSYFKRPVRKEEEVVGWYFGEPNQEHLRYWLEHPLPQLIVLYSPDSQETYWAHIEPDSIEYLHTGGWKLAVPRTNRIDAEHVADLTAVASSKLQGILIEGSSWEFNAVSPARRWRHALLAPRVVAPHRNKGTASPIDAQQGLALVVQRRIRDYGSFAEHNANVPALAEGHADDDWGWRFVASVADLIDSGLAPDLPGLADSAPTPEAAVAAAVVVVSGYFVRAKRTSAIEAIGRFLCLPQLADADKAWLLVHRARVHAEMGELAEAHADSLQALACVADEPRDVTVSSIAAVASGLLWQTVAFGTGDLGKMIKSSDTAVSWWRDQSTVSSLAEFVDESFSAWGESTSVTWSMEDPVILGLESALAMSQFAADQGAIRSDARLLARCVVISRPTEDGWLESLDRFRQIGDRESIELAIRRALAEGPVLPVCTVVEAIGEESWTRSSIDGNLAAWEYGADVMGAPTADRALEFCSEALLDDGHRIANLRPRYVLPHYLLKAMASLVRASSPPAQNLLLQRLGMLITSDQAERWGTLGLDAVSRAIDWNVIESALAQVWIDATLENGIGWPPALTILSGLYEREADAKNKIHEWAEGGNASALYLAQDREQLDASAVDGSLDKLEVGIRATIATAKTHQADFEGIDQAAQLAFLNVSFLESSRWDAIIQLLREPAVFSFQKAPVCKQIAVIVEHLPPEIHEQLASIVRDPVLATRQDMLGADSFATDLFLLRVALDVVGEGDRLERILSFLSGSNYGTRADCAEALGLIANITSVELGVLMSLISDASLSVRLAAAQAISRQVSNGCTEPGAVQCLTHCLKSDSVKVSFQALAGLSRRGSPLPDPIVECINVLADRSLSASVRQLARRILEYEALHNPDGV